MNIPRLTLGLQLSGILVLRFLSYTVADEFTLVSEGGFSSGSNISV